jgi:hypothetical protein
MTEHSIILWLSGYENQVGSFIVSMAPWLDRHLLPMKTYHRQVSCYNQTPPIFSWHSYHVSQSKIAHSFYMSCNGRFTMDMSECLADAEYTIKSGMQTFNFTSQKFEAEGAVLIQEFCLKKDSCSIIMAPRDIQDSVALMEDAFCHYKLGRPAHHKPHRQVVPFLGWNKSKIKISQHTSHHRMFVMMPQVNYVRGFREAIVHFKKLWSCGIHFAIARYGDGELAVLGGRDYTSITDIETWTYQPDAMSQHISNLIHDGFDLAKEHSSDMQMGESGMYLGLPLYFCAEGLQDFELGLGGKSDFLTEYFRVYGRTLRHVSSGRFVHSWIWGNANYHIAMDFVHEIGSSGKFILICNEAVFKRQDQLPSWLNDVLTVPGNAVLWLNSNFDAIKEKARELAVEHQDHVFGFSAGPVSNALIPLMWRTNPNNTYIDFGGSLDLEIHNSTTRAFHLSTEVKNTSLAVSSMKSTALKRNICHETRWNIVHEGILQPTIHALSVNVSLNSM